MNYKTDISTTRTITGANIELSNDYLENDISSIEIEGNTEQDGTPTPSSPVDIENVTGTQEINVIGKNLFDKDNANVLNDIYIDENLRMVKAASNVKSIYMKILGGKTYTVSKIASSRFRVATTKVFPADNVSVYNYKKNESGTNITITANNDSQYMVIFLYNSTVDTLTFEQILDSIQIEENNQATSYEPFKNNTYNIDLGDIELCKIGNYKDYIYKDNNKWYIHKDIGKVVLDGSENWVRSSSYSYAAFTNISGTKDIPASGDNNIYVYCDYYDRTYKTNLNNLSYCCALSNSSNLLIRNVDFTTNNDFKNWLSTHNTTVYYVLETPILEEITDLSLLKQLEAIRLFDKVNYIKYTSSTIQPSTFRLNYKTSEDKYLLLNDETVMYSKMIVKATDTEDEIILTESNSLKNWTYDDDRYTPNVGFIGQFIARTLSGELQNIDDDFDIENREVQICFGIKDFSEEVSETRWYTLGSFIIQKPEDNEVTDNTTYDAMDLTILFNKYFDADFTDNEYTTSFNSIIENGGSVTALWLANYVCKQVGIPFGNNFFTNCDFVINSNQFVSGEMCRDVMRAISQLSYGWVRIGWDDVCYIDEIINDVSEIRDYDIIDNDHYYSLTTQKKYFGPINKITVGMQDVNGEAISIQDSESVVNDGLTEVFVYDNPITYTNELRNTAVQNASYLLGMKYLPIETETPGHPWLKAYQPIIVKDMENRTYYSYPFNLEIKYAGHIRTTIKSPADTDVEKTESYDTTIYRTLKNLKIEVDKQAGVVTILNSNVQAALDGLEAFETRVEQTITDTYSKTEIQEIVNGVAPDGTKVTSVTTSSGTFDKDGLTVEQSTADTKTNINADGMIIYNKTGSTDDALLTVNSNGVITKNLKVSTYTELGSNSRFEDFVTDDYEDATAVFWIGS